MLAAALLRLTDDGETGEWGMNDDEQPESDGLDALASALPATESEEADEELDLASLAAVVGARATQPGTEAAPADPGEKLVLPKPTAPAPVPVPVPVPAPVSVPDRPRSWLVPALATFAIAVGVMGYVLGRSSRPEEQAAAPPPVATAAPTPAAPPPLAAAPTPPSPAANAPIAAPSAPNTPAPSTAPVQPIARTPRPTVPTAAAVASPSPEPSPAPVPAEPAPAKPAEAATTLAKTEPAPSRSVDALLDEALSGSGARPAPAAGPAELPEAPSRDEVTQAMAVLLPAIRGCAMGQTGLATAGIVVRGDGRVASVELSGAPFEGTASGRCMEGVLRRARFSRFRQPTFRVRFPFSIQ